MPNLNPAITLAGNLALFNHDGFEIEAMNFLFDRLDRGNLTMEGDVLYLGNQAVRHYTWRDKQRNRTCSMFYTFGNAPTSYLKIYGLGKHCGDSDKEHALYTWIDKKEALYTLAPTHSDSRFRSLLAPN